MELRNIKRALLAGKALRKYNKKARFEITQHRLHLLAVVHFMDEYSMRATQSGIEDKLEEAGRNIDPRNLKTQLTDLIEAGLLTKNDPIYRLTIEGKVALDTIEKLLRDERMDR